MKNLLKAAALSGVLVAQGALAEVTQNGWAPFVGLGAGYMTKSDKFYTEGMPVNLKLMGSYTTPESAWVSDLGVGVEHETFIQKEAGKDSTMFALEGATRYKMGSWSVGPVVHGVAGKASRLGSETDKALFGGAQVVREFGLDSMNSLMRVGMKATTDLNIHNDQIHIVMLEASMGFPGEKKVAKAAPVKASPAPVAATPAPQKVVLAATNVKAGTASQFDVGSAKVESTHAEYLKKLAAVLKANPGLVEKVKITGHTDPTGDDVSNMKLSEQRAVEISKVLQSNGIAKDLLQTEGKGEAQLIDDKNLSLNRRVEVEFLGVKDAQKLNEIIKSLQ